MPGDGVLVIELVLKAAIVMAAFLTLPLIVGQLEHKLMAHMQGRLGPMEAGGFHGWAQLIADGVKFAQKEAPVPAAADSPVYRLAPAVALVPYLLALAAIPFSATWIAADVPLGLLFVLAVVSIASLGALMAGWSSGNKYSFIGGMRAAAQLVSYELPLILAAVSVALAAGTLSLAGIVDQWQWWWFFWQLPGAAVFLIAAVAELKRPPLDAPIADAELVAGPYTEYSGLRYALLLLSEYAGIVVLSLLFTVLFLGGWSGPWSEVLGPLWTLLKAGLVAAVILWARVAWPRLRADQVQRLAWMGLIPLALIQIFLTSLGVVIFA